MQLKPALPLVVVKDPDAAKSVTPGKPVPVGSELPPPPPPGLVASAALDSAMPKVSTLNLSANLFMVVPLLLKLFAFCCE